MNLNDNLGEAIQLLQLLGLNENAARCYVALTRMDTATSRRLSEVAEVPRTRVYDMMRVLEAQGLVKVQHTNPKQFRALPIEEAIDRIRNRYQTRFDELQESLNTLEPVDQSDDSPTLQVWSINGREDIESRSIDLVKQASEEVHLTLGDDSLLTESFVEALTEAGRNIDLVIYAPTEKILNQIQDTISDATTFLLGRERLYGPKSTENRLTMGRILLIDQSACLISSIDLDTDEEQAVFSQGPKTTLVFIMGQLMPNPGLTASKPEM